MVKHIKLKTSKFLRQPKSVFVGLPKEAIIGKWIGFVSYNDTERKPNEWPIDKGPWIVVREALLHLNPGGFN